jgi:TldD protein
MQRSHNILTANDMDVTCVADIISNLQEKHIDFADVYFQKKMFQSWELENSIVKTGSFAVKQGFGARVINGSKTGFAFSNDITKESLKKSFYFAQKIAKNPSNKWQNNLQTKKTLTPLYDNSNPIDSISDKEKVQILGYADKKARSISPKVKRVNALLSSVFETILLLDSFGNVYTDIRPLLRFSISVVVEENKRRENGSAGGGGRFDFPTFINAKDFNVDYFINDAVRQALVNLESVDAPAGQMPVVLGPGWPGVLLHEAIGHGLEGDFIRKKTSVFSDKKGQKIASDICTVVDNGTLKNRRGSLSVDDEGTKTQNTVLIEKGILKNFMFDRLNSTLLKTKSTGNGRRESYAHLPVPRMTNTYMLAGESNPDDIIKSVKKGIYATNFGGGQVDITSGDFVFSASEAYKIIDGKIDAPIKGATLIGAGADVLTKISQVGCDLKLDTGVGTCGKDGQSVPVGVGQPTLKIEKLTVGGTE